MINENILERHKLTAACVSMADEYSRRDAQRETGL